MDEDTTLYPNVIDVIPLSPNAVVLVSALTSRGGHLLNGYKGNFAKSPTVRIVHSVHELGVALANTQARLLASMVP
jgi:hypothetical protein